MFHWQKYSSQTRHLSRDGTLLKWFCLCQVIANWLERMIMTKFITLSFLVCTGCVRTHQTTEFNESISCNSQRLNFQTILLWSFFKVFLTNNPLIVFKRHLYEWINVIDYCVQLIPVWQPFGALLTGILVLFSVAAPFETSQQPKAGRPTVPLVLTNVLICTSLNLIYQVNQWTMKGGGSIRVFRKQRLPGQQGRCAQTYICAAFRPRPEEKGFMLQS